MLRGCAAVAVLAIAVLARSAVADPLADAKAQVAASEYLKAAASLDAAYASGTYGPAQLAELWRLRGIVVAATGDANAATAAFQKSLALDPRAELPPGTSPKIARPFTAAQELARTAGPLAIKQETTPNPPAIAVTIASDPMSMIVRVQVTVRVDGGDEQQLDAKYAGQDQVELALPAGGRLDLRVAALDEHGNRLAELGTKDVPIVIIGKPVTKPDLAVKPVTAPAAPAAPPRERPLYWKWWLWGGGAIAFAGAATYFGIDGMRAKGELEDLNADSPNHTFDEAKDVESRARRGLLLSNIGYGVAGALAITAAILYLTEPDRPARPGPETRVTAVPVAGGGAIVLGGQF